MKATVPHDASMAVETSQKGDLVLLGFPNGMLQLQIAWWPGCHRHVVIAGSEEGGVAIEEHQQSKSSTAPWVAVCQT